MKRLYERRAVDCFVVSRSSAERISVNTKFRDEIRPRFGIMRSKEFIMKDAYSDMDKEGLEQSYQAMRRAYRTIFKRCGIETIPVEADTGSMGGRFRRIYGCVGSGRGGVAAVPSANTRRTRSALNIKDRAGQ